MNIFGGRFQGKILRSVTANGSSEGVNYLATALILFLFNQAFMSASGADGVAAFTVINYIGNFTTIVMFGISDGISSIISCNFGARKTDRVRQTMRAAVVINFLLGASVLVALIFFSAGFVELFASHNPSVMEMAVQGAQIYGTSFLFNGYNIVQSGYHTSVGNALASALIAASRGIVLIAIGVAVLPGLLGQNGIWAVLPFAELMTVFCCGLLAYYYRKKR